jgi:hypothetical protein
VVALVIGIILLILGILALVGVFTISATIAAVVFLIVGAILVLLNYRAFRRTP